MNSSGSFTVESLNLTLPPTVEEGSVSEPSTPRAAKGDNQTLREVAVVPGGTLGLDALTMVSEDTCSDMDISLE